MKPPKLRTGKSASAGIAECLRRERLSGQPDEDLLRVKAINAVMAAKVLTERPPLGPCLVCGLPLVDGCGHDQSHGEPMGDVGQPFAPGEARAMAQRQPGSVGPVAKIVRTKQPLLFPKRKTKSATKPEPIPFGAVAEFQFHPTRRWKIDWAYREQMVALEIEGGLFGRGKKCPTCGRRKVAGHSSVERIKTDLVKYRELSLMGWILIRVTPQEFRDGTAAELVKRAFEFRKSGGR